MAEPTEAEKERFLYYMQRQNLAYAGPSGSWAQRWLPGVCKHDQVRCTHGDEIVDRRWRRRVCMVCGRALRGPLPCVCFFTEEPHPAFVAVSGDSETGGQVQ